MSNNRNRIIFPAEYGRLQPQLAPAVQGGEPTYTLYLVYQDGTVYSLVGDETLEIIYQDTSDDEVYSSSAGLSIGDAEAGIVTWAAAAALGLAGSFWLQLKVNDETSLRVKWKVEAALDASGTVPPVAMTSLTAAQVALVQAISALTGLVKMAAGSATGIAVQSFMETFLESANAAAALANIGAAASSDLTTHTNLSTSAHGGILPEDAGIVSVSSGRDLASTDAGKILECSGTFAINCPNGLDTGFQCAIAPISGTVTLTATTTLQYWSSGTLVTASGAVTLNAMVTVYHAGSNVWRVAGDVTE